MTNDAAPSGMGRRRAVARDSRSAAYRDRRAEIVKVAARLFKEHGYPGTSFADIASQLSTERASIYYYFASKEEILDSVVTDVVIANMVKAERIRDNEGNAVDKLRELIVGLMVSFEEHYPFLYVYLQENMSHVTGKRQPWAQRMRQLNHRYESALQSIIEQGIAEGTIRPLTDPRILAYGMMGIVNWSNRWFNPGKSSVDAIEIGKAYAEILINGLAVNPEK